MSDQFVEQCTQLKTTDHQHTNNSASKENFYEYIYICDNCSSVVANHTCYSKNINSNSKNINSNPKNEEYNPENITSTNEEIKSTNEEIKSINEEIKSNTIMNKLDISKRVYSVMTFNIEDASDPSDLSTPKLFTKLSSALKYAKSLTDDGEYKYYDENIFEAQTLEGDWLNYIAKSKDGYYSIWIDVLELSEE